MKKLILLSLLFISIVGKGQDWLSNPANPASPLSPLNPANPASPLNPINSDNNNGYYIGENNKGHLLSWSNRGVRMWVSLFVIFTIIILLSSIGIFISNKDNEDFFIRKFYLDYEFDTIHPLLIALTIILYGCLFIIAIGYLIINLLV